MRFLHPLLCPLSFLLALGSGNPPPATVDLTWKGSPQVERFQVDLKAIPVLEGNEDQREPRTDSLWAPGSEEITLTKGVWWLHLEGNGMWALPQQVHVGEKQSAIKIDVWPAGTVKGRVRVPRGEAMPKEVLIKFGPQPIPYKERSREDLLAGRQAAEEPKGIQRCHVVERGFECRLPAKNLDLRIRAEGFITHYRWGVGIHSTAVLDLGELKLVRGASVVGNVVTHDGSPLTNAAKLTLQPAGLASPLREEQDPRSQLTVREEPVNDRGFFHFDGVKPGQYLLTASQEPYGPATVTVTVLEHREAALREPLVLAPPESISVLIEPPVDPDGQPWHLFLLRRDYYRSRAEAVVDEEVPVDGWWEREGLTAGTYVLMLKRPGGDPWVSQSVELGETIMPIRLEVTAVRVAGQVTLGDEPLSATIWYGTRFGMERVTLHTMEEGEYSGLLPRPGEWVVEVESTNPRVHRKIRNVEVRRPKGDGPAVVNIELPDTAVHVRVVDEAGQPKRDAIVDASPMGDHLLVQVWALTDEAGEAEFRGLAPGPHQLMARAGQMQSEAHLLMVAEEWEPPPVTLTVREKRSLRVRVVSAIGPVPGARLVMLPVEPAVARGRTVITDANGEVEYPLPGETRAVRFWLRPPGFAYRTGVMELDDGDYLEFKVSQSGGTLEVAAPDYTLYSDYHPSIIHNGAATGWPDLLQMASESGRSEGLNQLVVPDVEPGEYSLCWNEMLGRRTPAAPPRERCSQGTLLPLGRLALTLAPYPGEEEEEEDSGGRSQ